MREDFPEKDYTIGRTHTHNKRVLSVLLSAEEREREERYQAGLKLPEIEKKAKKKKKIEQDIENTMLQLTLKDFGFYGKQQRS